MALVCEADDAAALQRALATYAGTAFRADWVAVLADDAVLASDGNPPADAYLVALASGATSSPAVASGLAGPADLAAAPLTSRGAVLLVGRTGNEFSQRERAQLLALARIAEHVWRRLDGLAPPPPAGTVQWEMPTPPLVSAP